MKVWWTCSKRSAYGSGRCEAEYVRINEDWLLDSLNKLFALLLKNKDSFFAMIETKCGSIIKEYIRDTSGVAIEEAEERLDELTEQRERIKMLAIKGLVTMDEAERDMRPINEEIEQLRFTLNETDKTQEITSKVKASIREFFDSFSSFDFTANVSNEDLKKVIKEIRVISKNEIYVYFNISEDIEGLNFPINISEVFEISDKKTDTNYADGA